MYVNVGVKFVGSGSDIPTKSGLKEEIKKLPTNVQVYSVSPMGEQVDTTADKLQKGIKYSVCGPNPFKSRKWYATIEILDNGQVWCS